MPFSDQAVFDFFHMEYVIVGLKVSRFHFSLICTGDVEATAVISTALSSHVCAKVKSHANNKASRINIRRIKVFFLLR